MPEPVSITQVTKYQPTKIPFVGLDRLRDMDPAVRELVKLTEPHFDSGTQRDFIRYLAERKSKFTDGEVTMYGGKMVSNSLYNQDIGYYNPEEIPIATLEKMRRHPQVALGLALQGLPIRSLGFRTESPSAEAAAFGKEMFTPIWSSLLRDTMTAIPFGFYIGEMILQRGAMKSVTVDSRTGRRRTVLDRDDVISLKKVKGVYPDQIKIKTDAHNNFKSAVQVYGGRDIDIPANRTFRFTLDEEFGNFYGRTRLRPVYKPWYQSEIIMQFLLRYFDRRGTPPVIVYAPPGQTYDPNTGTTKQNLLMARDFGYALLSNSVGVLPFVESNAGHQKWDVKYLADDRRGDMFVGILEVLYAMILRGMFIPENVVGLSFDGKLEGTSNSADFFILMLESLINDAEEAINNGLYAPLLALNSEDWAAAGARLKIDKLMWSRRAVLKEVLMQMLRVTTEAVRQGMRPKGMPSQVDILNALDVPVAQFNDMFVEGPVPYGTDPIKGNDTQDKDTFGEGKDTGISKDQNPRQRAQKRGGNSKRRQITPTRKGAI